MNSSDVFYTLLTTRTLYPADFKLRFRLSRLLPIQRASSAVKSPELARRGNQQLAADEALVIIKWGKSFRPLHGTMGDLKLVASGNLP